MKLRLLLAAFAVFSFAPRAQAFLELKVGYSLINTDPKSFNDQDPVREAVKGMNGLTADLLLNAAIMPINIGARYETFAMKEGSGLTANDVSYERISVILNKRFIDTLGYLGMVATVGLSNEFKDKRTNNKASSSLSGSIGLETGIKFGFLMFGIEGGYLVAPLGELKTPTGGTVSTTAGPVEVDMTGAYGRAMVGFNF
jgi:hypothetical protein